MTEFNLANTIAADLEQEETGLSEIERAVNMGNLMVRASENVERLTEELKQAKKEYNSIAMEKLPALLEELGLTSIELTTGEQIKVKKDLSASITKANHDHAMKWLIENSYGGIIKTNVTVPFAATDQDAAAQFAESVMSEYDGVIYKAAVHPATLKSFVKERLAEGTALPLDVFSVHEYHIATLTR